MTTDKLIKPDVYPVHPTKSKAFLKGTLAMMPLTIAVVPWGILAGSFAIEVGLTPIESQAMSAIIFAGAAQLVALGMVKAGIGLWSILITTLLITSRHLLYAMAMRSQISPLPLKWRLTLGFLLTDELFAIANQGKLHKFDPWYALGGGLSFYIGWNIATLLGIVAGNAIENLGELGLDFAIAATFIALVVPTIKKPSILVCVLVSLTLAVVCAVFKIQAGLLIAAIAGMTTGVLYAKVTKETECAEQSASQLASTQAKTEMDTEAGPDIKTKTEANIGNESLTETKTLSGEKA
ncbi:AzlC family ABC transporter permease [Shewanella putrefaciens]|uniref:AzlC family ABC transporter permease n=1 Tax=Shewanella putrefaciens TaxID=24 RepID=UPI00286152FC|nr:AzlC family ABC transporter permease [Shewanella putrefaciens]MDR6963550.1 4-azaleucine resistance transporter AzlC [Shewanella putrefaciens]